MKKISRRDFLKAAGITVAATGLAACGGSSSSTAAPASSGAAAGPKTWAPTSPVSLILPAGAGGDTDLTARVFTQYAKEITGHDFIVVNASGASGSIAAQQVLDAAGDGHTCLYGHTLVNVAYIAGITEYNYTAFKLGPKFAKNPAQQLYVNPTKYADLDAFLTAAKANPGKLKACTEVGAYTYYELLLFESKAGIDLDLVDVGSNSEKIAAMLSGQIDLMPGAYLNCKDYLASGQFACLGAPIEERLELLGDIKTFKEQGIDMVYPDCDYGFYFPIDTPDEVIVFIEETVQAIHKDAAAAEAIANLNVMPYYLSAEEATKNDEWIVETLQAVADAVGA